MRPRKHYLPELPTRDTLITTLLLLSTQEVLTSAGCRCDHACALPEMVLPLHDCNSALQVIFAVAMGVVWRHWQHCQGLQLTALAALRKLAVHHVAV